MMKSAKLKGLWCDVEIVKIWHVKDRQDQNMLAREGGEGGSDLDNGKKLNILDRRREMTCLDEIF